MNKLISSIFIFISIIFLSCATTTNTDEKPKMGEKGGVCYNTLTCNSGLICIDMICESDPCYGLTCDPWKTCDQGECKLIPNKCEKEDDCSNENAVCDVNHNCIVENNPCENQNCSNNGKCFIESDTNTPICNCNTGYNNDSNPLECIENQVVDLCENSNCEEWETCNSNNGECELTSGRCEIDTHCLGDKICDSNHNCVNPANPCEGVTCSNHGDCLIDTNNLAKCNCDNQNGYFPDSTGLSCLNPCLGNENCGGYGVCTPTSSTNAICECVDGYKASGLTCVEDNLCLNSNCSEWKPCNISTGACVLTTGRCDQTTDCSGGQVCDINHYCVTADLCEGVVCPDSWKECRNGVCELKDGKCDNTGDCPEATPACLNNSCIDLCDNLNCGTHGECLSDETEAICVCNTGYKGLLCNECADGYQDNDNNGTCETYTIWCNLQSPTTINQEENTVGELVFGRVYVAGITESTEVSPMITAELGYTPYDVTNPIVEGDFFWVNASYNSACGDCGNNDEYMTNFPADLVGDFNYIYRFSINNGATWLYCDLNGVGGIGSDPFEINQVGTATITEATQSSNNTDLIISEYIEGGSYNKAIEIYNGTGASIDLSNYSLKLATNGADWSKEIVLSGSLNIGNLYVITNSAAIQEIKNLANTTVLQNSSEDVTGFNGDDAIGLFKNGVLIDVVGTPTNQTIWEVAGTSNATQNHTLLRKSTVTSPNTDWTSSRGIDTSNSEWIVLPQDDYTNLGSITPAQ